MLFDLYGLKADNASLGSTFALAMAHEKANSLKALSDAKADLLSSISKVEAYVNDLTHRVTTLESGQDEWTQSLRTRTHTLANDVQTLVVKVALLERIHHPKGHES